MKKKLIALFLALVMILGVTTVAYAATGAETGGAVEIRTGLIITPPCVDDCDDDDCDSDFYWNNEPVGDLWFGTHDLGHTDAMPSIYRTAGDPTSGGRLTGVTVRHALPMIDPGNGDPWGARNVAVSISTFTLNGAGAVEGKVGFILDFNAEGTTQMAGAAPTQVAGTTLQATAPGTVTVLNVNANTYSLAVWSGNIQTGYVAAPQVGLYQATLTLYEVTAP